MRTAAVTGLAVAVLRCSHAFRFPGRSSQSDAGIVLEPPSMDYCHLPFPTLHEQTGRQEGGASGDPEIVPDGSCAGLYDAVFKCKEFGEVWASRVNDG